MTNPDPESPRIERRLDLPPSAVLETLTAPRATAA